MQTNRQFDVIVSNPLPFSLMRCYLPIARKAVARHTVAMSYDDLLAATNQLLAAGGRSFFIIPATSEKVFVKLASEYGLYLFTTTYIHPRTGKPANRVVLGFTHTFPKATITSNALFVREDTYDYSTDYAALTRDFYLDKQSRMHTAVHPGLTMDSVQKMLPDNGNVTSDDFTTADV
ncbi:MAG: hypothetical protein R2795_20020 [Saprospiraceae bacterium]